MLTLNTEEHCDHYYAFCGREIVLHSDAKPLSYSDVITLRLSDCCAASVTDTDYGISAISLTTTEALPVGLKPFSLRLYNDGCGEKSALLASRAKALVEWIADTRFCPRCGKPLSPHGSLAAMECESCGNLVFPRINPCIIVLVRRGREMLLARHVQRNQTIYACIAGFMEAGETAEQTVAREVFEETGIKVRNIKYFGSQSWPYPAQLMLGFTAEYDSGELRLQESEIADAAWFSPDNLPPSPEPGSIAYRLIHSRPDCE